MNPIKIFIILLLLLTGTAGCASYLYTAYVPAAAYTIAQGINTNSPETEAKNPEIVLATADGKTSQTDGTEYINPAEDAIQADGGITKNAKTGRLFANMQKATHEFRDQLRKNLIDNADDYVLTRVDKVNEDDFILIAAVYRPHRLIEVADKKFHGIRNVITDKSPAFYTPYQTDIDGHRLDKVVAWSLVPVSCLQTPEQQEMVLAGTAGTLLSQKSHNEFWTARQQWVDGNMGAMMLAGNLMSCPARG